MNSIPIPVIFFGVFLILAVVLNYLHNRTATKYHRTIKDWVTQNAIAFDSFFAAKAATSQIGRKMNDGIAMAKCEILVTDDAVIILGKTHLNVNSNPIIFTRNSDYALRFPFAKVVLPNRIDLNTSADSIYFEFGEASLSNYLFTIRIYNVTKEFVDKIKKALNDTVITR